ncbi:MAG: hypothetical protein KH549_10520 [Clostridium sp.]|nr:hypothetical protein [Clostridium sp.]
MDVKVYLSEIVKKKSEIKGETLRSNIENGQINIDDLNEIYEFQIEDKSNIDLMDIECIQEAIKDGDLYSFFKLCGMGKYQEEIEECQKEGKDSTSILCEDAEKIAEILGCDLYEIEDELILVDVEKIETERKNKGYEAVYVFEKQCNIGQKSWNRIKQIYEQSGERYQLISIKNLRKIAGKLNVPAREFLVSEKAHYKYYSDILESLLEMPHKGALYVAMLDFTEKLGKRISEEHPVYYRKLDNLYIVTFPRFSEEENQYTIQVSTQKDEKDKDFIEHLKKKVIDKIEETMGNSNAATRLEIYLDDAPLEKEE